MKSKADTIDTVLVRLAATKRRDEKLYPPESWIHQNRRLVEWMAVISGLIAGHVSWYNDQAKIALTRKILGQLEAVRKLYGCVPTEVIGRLQGALRQRLAALLGLSGRGTPGDGTYSQPPSIFPTASNGDLKSALEMNHAFFNIAKDKTLQLRNLDERDYTYHATGVVGGAKSDPRLTYRIPAGGAWTSIPPFQPDPRVDVQYPGRHLSAGAVFKRRHVLEIRVAPAAETAPPMNVLEEREAAISREHEEASEINDLIDAIAKGE